jgi:hypothetical protein
LSGLVFFNAGLEARFRNPGEFESLDFDSFFDLNCGLFLLKLGKEHAWLHPQVQCQNVDIFHAWIDWKMYDFASSNLF